MDDKDKARCDELNNCIATVINAPSVVPDFKTFCGVPIEEAIDVLEKHTGKWLRKDGRVWSECSACGSGSSFETKFCGNCGARMKGYRNERL